MTEQLIHATAIALNGKAVLLCGPPGSGKSDLALRAIEGRAVLIADDQTRLHRAGDLLLASCPESIRGRLEVRGIGIVAMPMRDRVPVVLAVDLVSSVDVERMPEYDSRDYMGISIPLLRLAPFEASALAKLRLAVARLAGE
ncbi:MAG: HPr kinase/phosphatase C-terminal domain-containing protein [Alphaproteobacteria bacterium]|nr:HPr kinase/phosphatase C-terminal domain-containing protein [Alphaproteobacteria bacterium]MBU0797412.1 HPr kinase/phosphatase C-terminal domain-containing protein [Alphaproteobacteria bacterium]MBU0888531.1 HPr kinase/phosphatase C-terminal domain-containing protein [Alphaproteobacteria bacterium]MBU1813735.1 HPr kinase/phosphatase C-terminal domain-containing protein [Alphaproteobacteria bacterium]MBU2091975.1 HPr kinase/phosphatase C-terminal domain-containing protein [Alphaproteobacteria